MKCWKEQDPDPDPEPLVRGMDPRIRTKMSYIRNTDKQVHYGDGYGEERRVRAK